MTWRRRRRRRRKRRKRTLAAAVYSMMQTTDNQPKAEIDYKSETEDDGAVENIGI
jgi:hypothetical protein